MGQGQLLGRGASELKMRSFIMSYDGKEQTTKRDTRERWTKGSLWKDVCVADKGFGLIIMVVITGICVVSAYH
jgi:hypothetical protein